MTTVADVPLARNRNFTLLWVGQGAAEVGFSASMLAFPLVVLAVTGSAAASGLVLAADAVAQAVLALPGGALVDRWDRRRIMLACEVAQAVALASLVAALLLDGVSLLHLAVVAAVLGGCRALFEPAEDALLPSLVPESRLATAVATNSARSSIGQMAGTALGGVLFGVARWAPFLLDLVTHVVAFVMLAFLRAPTRPPAESPALGREIAEGLRWLWQRGEIRVTTACAVALNLFFAAYYLVVVVLAERQGTPAGEIGVMAAMLGVGGVVGAMMAPWLHRRLSPHAAIAGVFWALAALCPLAVLADSGYLLGALFAAMALLAPTANTTIITHQLLLTPDALRGRLSGTLNVAMGGAAAAGPALGGVLAEAATPTAAVLVCAAGMTVAAIAVTVNRTLRYYPREESQCATTSPTES
ncbi:MFS transporter [Actinophytocola oryzae]|uniref:Putative MFS family arabinose efflux permease n=1 Tax=Actinophytocola oryzae TaxID=502181 RepID=A0A4R7W4D5_9PSEU|nr:MFS transporter [Actinophytocola oryzae]TDV57556.1 putative MFS family arabinose efflux permease [Actinophytocola oryzae]